jgi:hypothetical protein
MPKPPAGRCSGTGYFSWVVPVLIVTNILTLAVALTALVFSGMLRANQTSLINTVQVSSSGQTGINTASPQATLDVRCPGGFVA